MNKSSSKSLNLDHADHFNAASIMSVYEKFAQFYDLIYKDIVNYSRETDEFETLFKRFSKKRPESILDVGCGTGSHSLLLSKRGYTVTGIDISERMIALAKNKASKEGLKVDFSVQDMRKLDLGKRFDCALCAFGGFGYLLTFEDLREFLSHLKMHLKPDGLFMFEFWNVGGVRPSPLKSWLKVQTGTLVLYRLSESNFDPLTNVLAIDFHFIELHKKKLGETFSETHKIRCYTLPEMKKYLEDNGFKLVEAFDWNARDTKDFKPPEKDSFRILTVARRV